MSERTAMGQATAKAASASTLAKLVVFSVSLGVAPLASYFLSGRYLWDGNSTYAAITAVFAANFVLVAYIISSLREDKNTMTPNVTEEKETKKTR